jgi:hypoxia up-regulated 1
MEEKTIEVPAEEGDKDTEGKDGDKKDAKKDAKDAKKEEAKKDDKKGKKDAKEDDKKKDEKKEDKKDEKPKTVTKKITVPKRKMMHVALKVDGPRSSLPALSGGVLTAAQANVSAFALREAVKRDTARAKNDLESYIISTREKLEDDGVAAVRCREGRGAAPERGAAVRRARRGGG